MPIPKSARKVSAGWEQIERWRLQGKLDQIRQHEQELAEFVQRSSSPEQRVRVSGLLASTHIAMLRKGEAAVALRPYLTLDDRERVGLETQEIEGLSNPYLKAVVLSEAAQQAYRSLRYDEGVDWARQAEWHFREAELKGENRDSEGVRDAFLGRCLNSVWLSRLQFRLSSKSADIDRRLADTVRELEDGYRMVRQLFGDLPRAQEYKRGHRVIDWTLAIALELWAAIDWTRGLLARARSKVFRSLFLLDLAEDTLRKAHAYYTAGRIEYSYERSDYEWAAQLLQQSENSLRTLPQPAHRRSESHPFLSRPIVMNARCALQLGEFAETERLLREAQEEVARIQNPLENAYAEAECRLTRVWIYLAKAEHPKDWMKCAEEAETLVESSDPLPERLRIEGLLHAGRARTHLPQAAQRNEGRAQIEEARSRAQKSPGRFLKLEAACHLALTEAYLSSDQDQADFHFEQATRLCKDIESVYLRSWRDKVSARLAGPILIDMNQPFSESEKEFIGAYLRYHTSRSRNVDELLNATGWSQSKYYRVQREFGRDARRYRRPSRGS